MQGSTGLPLYKNIAIITHAPYSFDWNDCIVLRGMRKAEYDPGKPFSRENGETFNNFV